ncbi:P-loop containing nucleoside triphosphate hydrolase protein [Favolaschia claudopus]|uniref:P-loop containing nucleoside triphosphate hydrolase protein n=1 Tax=Favolaschia claudopus TaxID=2862362 RepID=A0AAV9ZFI9_9AGAR
MDRRQIVVLGAPAAGKSSLIAKYCNGSFNERYYPSLETKFRRVVNFDDIQYNCSIIDTEGQDQFSLFKEHHVTGTHGYILVYSMCHRQSFDLVQVLYKKIMEYTGHASVAVVIVGCKADLESNTLQPPSRQIERVDLEGWAKSVGAQWIETSAKTGSHVDAAFELCLREIKRQDVELHLEFQQNANNHVQRCVFM